MSGASSLSKTYSVPKGVLRLKGPVEKPRPGTLPLRGDLAHVALAGDHFAAHYVVPQAYIAASGAQVLLAPTKGAEAAFTADAGEALEVLDTEGDWAWVCKGPDGPSGYCLISELAPLIPGG